MHKFGEKTKTLQGNKSTLAKTVLVLAALIGTLVYGLAAGTLTLSSSESRLMTAILVLSGCALCVQAIRKMALNKIDIYENGFVIVNGGQETAIPFTAIRRFEWEAASRRFLGLPIGQLHICKIVGAQTKSLALLYSNLYPDMLREFKLLEKKIPPLYAD
jgi:hypothetical protein